MQKLASAALIALAATTVPARSQVVVQTPWFCLHVGPPAPTRVLVQTPWVTVGVNPGAHAARPAQAAPAPAEPTGGFLYEPGAPPPVPLPIAVETAPSRAPTLAEFAAKFQPKPGRYELAIEHPFTGRPVQVSFTLPDGTPRRVKVYRRGVDFDYGRQQVSIRFLRGGDVRVRE